MSEDRVIGAASLDAAWEASGATYSREHHQAAFLAASARDQLVASIITLAKAGESLPADSQAIPSLLEAAEHAHILIHNLLTINHEEAAGRFQKAMDLLKAAGQSSGAKWPNAWRHVDAALKNVETAFEAYDGSFAALRAAAIAPHCFGGAQQ